jgi:hypothetical protein
LFELLVPQSPNIKLSLLRSVSADPLWLLLIITTGIILGHVNRIQMGFKIRYLISFLAMFVLEANSAQCKFTTSPSTGFPDRRSAILAPVDHQNGHCSQSHGCS